MLRAVTQAIGRIIDMVGIPGLTGLQAGAHPESTAEILLFRI
jgi:hypothetical protein